MSEHGDASHLDIWSSHDESISHSAALSNHSEITSHEDIWSEHEDLWSQAESRWEELEEQGLDPLEDSEIIAILDTVGGLEAAINYIVARDSTHMDVYSQHEESGSHSDTFSEHYDFGSHKEVYRQHDERC